MPETNILAPMPRGHRELSLAEIALLNEIDVQGDGLQALCLALETRPGVDKRALAIARTELQTGLMWLTRAVARPDRF